MDRTILNRIKVWWRQPLALALCVSLLLHALFYSTWRVGRALGWWQVSMPFISKFFDRVNSMLVDSKKIEKALKLQREANREIPLTFVDVLPQQATTEAPEKPDFYGALNSQAASKEAAEKDSELPKIDGQQDKVFKTVDIARNTPAPVVKAQPAPAIPAKAKPPTINPDKLQPSAEPDVKTAGRPDVPETTVAKLTPANPGTAEPLRVPAPPSPKPGDLVHEHVNTQPEKGEGVPRRGDNGESPLPRPRTIAAAEAQLPQNNSIAGQKMKLEGSSRRQQLVPSFKTEGTPWGSYDAKFIAIVTSRWYRYLDQHPEAFNFGGRVVVEFRLMYDGSIKDFNVVEKPSDFDSGIEDDLQTYGCLKAVVPEAGNLYDPWPPMLRRITRKDYRELRFTFYYN